MAVRCPTCGRLRKEGDFLCPHCEAILDVSTLAGMAPEREVSVVRSLLSPPQAGLGEGSRPPPPPPEAFESDDASQATSVFSLPAGEDDVPCIAGQELPASQLTTFDAYLLSLMDGRTSVRQLGRTAQLSPMEMGCVLRSLLDRSLIRIERGAVNPHAVTELEMPAIGLMEPPPDIPTARVPALIPSEAVPPQARNQAALASPPVLQPTGKAAPAAIPRAQSSVHTSAKTPTPKPAAAKAPLPSPAPPARGPRPSPPPRPQPSASAPARHGPPPAAPRRPPQGVFESPLQRAINLERAGKLDEAIKVLEHAVSRAADPAPLYNRLAIVVLKEHRDCARAEKLLHKALELDPENEVYKQNLMKTLSLAASSMDDRKRVKRRS